MIATIILHGKTYNINNDTLFAYQDGSIYIIDSLTNKPIELTKECFIQLELWMYNIVFYDLQMKKPTCVLFKLGDRR